jgi:hypothetical protein
MPPNFKVRPYKSYSRSGKLLAEALGAKRLKPPETSKYKPRPNHVVINWGSSAPTAHLYPATVLNHPEAVGGMADKLKFFKLMRHFCPEVIPEFWTNQEDIPDEAFPVVCRTVLNGHSGAGIVISNNRSELVLAPLYVRYMKKKDEYRVHLGAKSSPHCSSFSSVISVQQKKRSHACAAPNWQVRNHANGFIYARDNVRPPACVLSVARTCFENSGLDFGAVDVVYNEASDKAYVLEINTAPGVEGQTVTDYANFFLEI